MRNLLCFIFAATFSMSLSAQLTGRITGKVQNSQGKPIPNAVVTLKRLDITSEREIKTNAKGEYLQAGLHPTEHEMTVNAEGYATHKEMVKIPLNDFVVKNITLRTPEEQLEEMRQSGTGEVKATTVASEGDSAYTSAVTFFNNRDYAEALPRFESAIEFYNESLTTTKDDKMKEDIEGYLATAIDSLAVSQFEVGKADPGQRNELWLKAEPIFLTAYEKIQDEKSKDTVRFVSYLYEIAKMKGDTEAEKKYTDKLEEIEGPKAEVAYNAAVEEFNAGNLSAAKPHLKRALEINPNFSAAYYLLGICEYADGNLKVAKDSFLKYLELDPNGKYATEIKDELLTDPSFKNIK